MLRGVEGEIGGRGFFGERGGWGEGNGGLENRTGCSDCEALTRVPITSTEKSPLPRKEAREILVLSCPSSPSHPNIHYTHTHQPINQSALVFSLRCKNPYKPRERSSLPHTLTLKRESRTLPFMLPEKEVITEGGGGRAGGSTASASWRRRRGRIWLGQRLYIYMYARYVQIFFF